MMVFAVWQEISIGSELIWCGIELSFMTKISFSAPSSIATEDETSSNDRLKASPVGENPRGGNKTIAPFYNEWIIESFSTFLTTPVNL